MKVKGETRRLEQDACIARFLKGQMSPGEEKEFRERLRQDAELKSKAIALARMVKAMKEVGGAKDRVVVEAIKDLKSPEAARQQTAGVTGKAKLRVSSAPRVLSLPRRALVSMSAAASILLCVCGGYRLYDNQRMNALGREYLACFPAAVYTRGGDDDAAAELAKIYQSVAADEDVAPVIARLEKLWALSRENEYNKYTEYTLPIGWMLANAYLRQNNKDKALQVLDTLIREAEGGSAIATKAAELKKEIERRKIF